MTRKSDLPEHTRASIDDKANTFVDTVLKPRLVIDQPRSEFNSVVDVVKKWRGSSLYFISIYRVGSRGDIPGDTFEAPFARMQYKASNRFGLSFMRHTGRWVEVYPALTVEECLKSIRDDPFFTG